MVRVQRWEAECISIFEYVSNLSSMRCNQLRLNRANQMRNYYVILMKLTSVRQWLIIAA